MKTVKKYIEKIPSWAIFAIINGDYDGLNEEDGELINKWLEENNYAIVGCPSEDSEPYFTPFPAFGLPCDVYDCECLVFE